jgi:hypothetical protein
LESDDHSHASTGAQAGQLAQANTHQSPDTDSAAGSLHHTIGTGANQAAAGNHIHNGFTVITKSADQDVTNAQNTNDTELQFAVTAGKHYIVRLFLLTSGNNTTGDFEWRLAVSAGTMDGRGLAPGIDATNGPAYISIGAVAATSSANIPVGVNAAADLGFPTVSMCEFAFRQNTSSGTLNVQFGNNSASSGRTSRMMQGSTLTYRQTD